MNNQEMIQNIQCEIKSLGYRNTPEIRAISKKYYKYISNKPCEEIFLLCIDLLETRIWSNQIIAYDWGFRLKKHYSIDTFTIFEQWLYLYIKDWYDCDDFCCHALGALIYEYPQLVENIKEWTNSNNFAIRRAASVVFIYSIRKERINRSILWEIVKILMHDEHYLVLKGYGWLLKEMTKKLKVETIQFLQEYETQMPRLSFRYAIGKLTAIEKKKYFKTV